MSAFPTVGLNDGSRLPAIGLGTWPMQGAEAYSAVTSAIEVGYRLFDTGPKYGNEAEVGAAILASGVDRDEFTVTTKLPGRAHGDREARASARASLATLGLERIDLLLIHWPNPHLDRFVETWRAMVDLRDEGIVRTIGVSNFTEPMLERLVDETGVVPAVNQVEMHPAFPQADLRAVHELLGIRTESWSPLGRTERLQDDPLVGAVADSVGITPAQAILRWHIELGSTPIPKSSSRARQYENADVFDVELSPEQLDQISSLERGRLWGEDPNTYVQS